MTRPHHPANLVDEGFVRPEPALTPRTTEYWTSGADGTLRIARCDNCERWMHPPRPICARCRSTSITPTPVIGTGQVYSFTINRYEWSPAIIAPYAIAEVELDDVPEVRLLTSIVGCSVDVVCIGMRVEVCFARSGDAWIPLFRPATGATR